VHERTEQIIFGVFLRAGQIECERLLVIERICKFMCKFHLVRWISLITLYQFFKNKRFQEDQFTKTNNRAFTSKLYDLRLEYYPEAFEIMDDIYKEKGGIIPPATAKKLWRI
jgi:hypothetical protein